jgi:hypothetical protein
VDGSSKRAICAVIAAIVFKTHAALSALSDAPPGSFKRSCLTLLSLGLAARVADTSIMKEDNVSNPPAEPGILSFGTLATTHDELRRSLIQELNDIKSSNQKSHQEIGQAEATRNKIQYEFKERIPAETQSLTRSMAHLTENQSIHKQFFSGLQQTMKVHVLATNDASTNDAALAPDAGYRSETTSEVTVPGEDGFVNSKEVDKENEPSPGKPSLIPSEEKSTITKITDIRPRHTTLVGTFVRLEENRKKGEQSLESIASRYQQLQGQWVDLSDRSRREDTAGQLRAIENDISRQRHRASEEDKRGTTLKHVLGKLRARVEQACHKERAQVCKANRMDVFNRRPMGLIDALDVVLRLFFAAGQAGDSQNGSSWQ